MVPENPLVLVAGTRPEGIKIAPLYLGCKQAGLPVHLCCTMQHEELLTQVLDLFDITSDSALHIMRPGQDLFYVTQSVLQKTKELFLSIRPRAVVVQGDTTSTFAAALSAFYLKIPVIHIEAGLRTADPYEPFPEEMNRRLVSQLAAIHCAPTEYAAQQLLGEAMSPKNVFCTGNTVVDALRIMKERIDAGSVILDGNLLTLIQKIMMERKKLLLLTIHRRESFDGGIERVLTTIKQFLLHNPNVECIYPYHPNPSVIQAIQASGIALLLNIHLREPIAFADMVNLLHCVDGVLTDSGGIQEEAVSLGKRVLVLRNKTERVEGVNAGLATVVGTDSQLINQGLEKIVNARSEIVDVTSIYGDGYASEKIIEIIKDRFFAATCIDVIQDAAQEIDQALFLANKVEGNMKKISVIGLGYIGLPTSVVMAESGCEVVGFDIDVERVAHINAGDPVIQEPELYEKLQLALQAGRFRATTEIESADCFVIAVPTPFQGGHEQKIAATVGATALTGNFPKADLSYVFAAADSIACVIKKGDIVLLESTVPVGATMRLALFLEEKTGLKAGTDIFVAHCPERVLPGNIFHELVYNDRVVGGITPKCAQKAQQIYKLFVQGECVLTDAATAEMVKLVENSCRDTELAFAHQVASMALSAGLNPYDVIELANKHPRVNILKPSVGVGGHCIAVDPWFLIETFEANSTLLQSARQVNDGKPFEVLHYANQAIRAWKAEHNRVPTVLALGLTYKPNVDDLRESPAVQIVERLQGRDDIVLRVCEPHIKKTTLESLTGKTGVGVQEGVESADIILFLVAHTRFTALDHGLLQKKWLLDFCGILHSMKKNISYWPSVDINQLGQRQEGAQSLRESLDYKESGA